MFEFTIKPDGGPEFQCEATSRDIVRWEASGKGKSLGTLTDHLRMTDLTDLAWFAADRLGLTDLDRRTFAASIDLDFKQKGDDDEDADDEAGPTPAAR